MTLILSKGGAWKGSVLGAAKGFEAGSCASAGRAARARIEARRRRVLFIVAFLVLDGLRSLRVGIGNSSFASAARLYIR